jgi:glycosyltransferase involved in cell wall biosynthesis
VAGEGACYFDSIESLCHQFDEVMSNAEVIESMRDASRRRFKRALTWPIVLAAYERLLSRFLPAHQLDRSPIQEPIQPRTGLPK